MIARTTAGARLRKLLPADAVPWVPDGLFDVEVHAVLRRWELKAVLTPAQAVSSRLRLMNWRLRRAAVTSISDDAWAFRQNITFSDACYVEIAQRLNGLLLTTDAKLASAPMKFEVTVTMNSKGLHMKVMSSTMALFAGTADRQQPILRVDYDRAAVGKSAAHVHLQESPELSALRSSLTPIVLRETSGIHFPLGNHRFRPSLEEFLRFLIEEAFTGGRPGWSEILDERQADWLRIQAEAVADKNQEAVAGILRANGWTVTPPAEG